MHQNRYHYLKNSENPHGYSLILRGLRFMGFGITTDANYENFSYDTINMVLFFD